MGNYLVIVGHRVYCVPAIDLTQARRIATQRYGVSVQYVVAHDQPVH